MTKTKTITIYPENVGAYQHPWEPFWSYQLNRTANPAHLLQIWPDFEVIGLDWQCCLASRSKTAPRILIFSIAIDADYSDEVKNSEIWAPVFFKHTNSFKAATV